MSVAAAGTEMTAAVASGTTQVAVAEGVTAANAVEAASSYPWPYSLAVAGAAVASLIGMIAAFQRFSMGGTVSGGIPGQDSVPALLAPGEVVETAAEVRANRQRGAGRGSGGVNVYVDARSPKPVFENSARQYRQLVNDVVPAIRLALRNGHLTIPANALER